MTTKTVNTNPTLDAKAKFNALSNATHIFAFKEEGTPIKFLDVVKGESDTKAVVVTEDGEIHGLFTDSVSARSAISDLQSAFGKDQPFVKVNVRQTPKGLSVYFFEVI